MSLILLLSLGKLFLLFGVARRGFALRREFGRSGIGCHECGCKKCQRYSGSQSNKSLHGDLLPELNGGYDDGNRAGA